MLPINVKMLLLLTIVRILTFISIIMSGFKVIQLFSCSTELSMKKLEPKL